jgi:hypothetical protein
MNEAVRRVTRLPGVYRTMWQLGRREIRERQARLVLAVTLAAHAGAGVAVQWPALAGACALVVGAGCLAAAYNARPAREACRVTSSKWEARQ